ncbi:DUF4007 family protein [Methylomonas koyamae]|uniref:DUF4007 domain-containing protein n=1 Tax=Methylomonas koyamae TaxID=702114 RepID=A0A177NI38_9GAMM|nr:DUF4007 family protein [Methylomonas koyamae]OAI17522.1 hypothetical protein A1355_07745 [Methylomonas koyamae]
MIPLRPDCYSFGRHETFPLRFGWLTKGYQAWLSTPGVFEDDDATVKLGVGKNMVSAIKYWLIATQMINCDRQSIMSSELGERIFSPNGWDPYLEDDATIWLLHWLISSNPAEATTPFWFFNRFHKPEFTMKELIDAQKYFVSEHLSAKVSEATLKHDLTLLVRMYQPTLNSKSVPSEEGLDSPVAMLGLMEMATGSKYHESKPEFRSVPVAIFAFSVAQVLVESGAPNLPIERLMRSDGVLAAPGSVFRLTEECLITKLEEMIAWYPGVFNLRESAGIHQLYLLKELEPISLLRRHYIGAH